MEDLDYLIGLRIKALLAIRKTNIQDLSDEFNVSYSTFRSYLNGRRKIPSDIILKLSNKFNCSTDYFYTGDMTLLTKEADMASLNAIVIQAAIANK